MSTLSDPGSNNTLNVSPANLKDAAQTLRTINTNTHASYQTSYNHLLDSTSLLPAALQSWAIDNLHTWNKYIQNQVFSGNEQMAQALDSAADEFTRGEQYVVNMFTPQE